VADNLTTHVSATLVLLVATLCGIPAKLLGVKARAGILKSVSTPESLLGDVTHRVRFVFVPKHTSWMNQVEIWFSVLSRRVIRALVPLADDLRADLEIHRLLQRTMRSLQMDVCWPSLNVGSKKGRALKDLDSAKVIIQEQPGRKRPAHGVQARWNGTHSRPSVYRRNSLARQTTKTSGSRKR